MNTRWKMEMSRSRGVQFGLAIAVAAMVGAVPLPPANAAEDRFGPEPEQYRKTVSQGIEYLRTAQSEDGSYSAQAGPAVTALAATALLRNGLSPDDPLVAHVEHVHAARRLLEVAEEHALAGEREGEDRAVDGAVEHRERRVPAPVGQEPVERGQHAVEELADGLAPEEALVVRDDAAEGVDELGLELLGRDAGEPVAAQLAQLLPLLEGRLRGDDAGRSDGAAPA